MPQCASLEHLRGVYQQDAHCCISRADEYVVATRAPDHFITHTMDGIDKTNEAIEALHGGDCLRAVVKYSDY